MILIFCAFNAEFEPLRRRIHEQKALGIEGLRGCYGRIGTTQVALASSGVGMRRARESARRVLDKIHDIDLVLLTGVAGGLIDNLAIGEVVLADRLITRRDDNELLAGSVDVPRDHLDHCVSALEAAAIRYTRGALLTVKFPLMTAEEKRLAGQNTGAIAVDMETAVIAFEAAARRIPFAAIRTIMDTVDHNLIPAGLTDRNGHVRLLKAAAMLLRNPAMVAGGIRLMRNLRQAAHSMAVTVEAVTRRIG